MGEGAEGQGITFPPILTIHLSDNKIVHANLIVLAVQGPVHSKLFQKSRNCPHD
jgi:hypothetical protein